MLVAIVYCTLVYNVENCYAKDDALMLNAKQNVKTKQTFCYLLSKFRLPFLPFYLISFVMFLVFLTHCTVLLSFLHEVLLYSTERGIEQKTAHSITFTLASFFVLCTSGCHNLK